MNPKQSIGFFPQLTLAATVFAAVAQPSPSAYAATLTPAPDGNASRRAIRWTDVGSTVGAQYSGNSLGVTSTEDGARLRCVFQHLEGEATREGLWLSSTVRGQPNDRFRVTAATVGRE